MEGDAAPGAAEAAGRRDGGRAPESPGSRGSARSGRAGLSAGEWETFSNRGSPLPTPMAKGAAVYFLFLEKKKNISLLLLLFSHVKLFISAAVGAADGGG